MAALGFQCALAQVISGSLLRMADCSGWLERNAKVDGGSVGNATLDTAGVVCFCDKALARCALAAELGLDFGGNKGVVVD